MKPSKKLNYITTSLAAGLLAVGSSQAATFRWDGGAGSSDWTVNNNWNPNGSPPPTGIVTTNRIDIDAPSQELVYAAAQGDTTFGSGTTVRGLVIGSGASGTLRITGGNLTTVGSGAATDLLGNINLTSTGTLIVDGGGYIAKHLTLNNNNSHGILTLNTGTATIETLTLNLQDTGDSIVNLNGGTLNVKTLTARTTGTATMNFNGGTLQAGATFSAPTAGISYVVKSGGAKIDTNGFDVTIGSALVHDAGLGGTPDGGLIKSGVGTLNLNASNTYTGNTAINAGTLSVGHAGALGASGGGTVTVAGGTLALGAFDLTKTAIALNSGTLTGSAYSGNVNIGGASAITGTFSGTVDSGTVAARAIDTTGGLSVGTLDGQGTFSGGLVTVTGQHNPGNSPGTQTFNDGLTYNASTTINMEIAADGLSADRINVNNGLTIGSTVTLDVSMFGSADYGTAFWDSNQTFTVFALDSAPTGDFNLVDLSGLGSAPLEGSWSSGWSGNNYNAVWTAVPEPAAALLGSLGMLVLLRRRR